MGEEAFSEKEVVIADGKSILLRRRHGDTGVNLGICESLDDLPSFAVNMDAEQRRKLIIALGGTLRNQGRCPAFRRSRHG